MSRSNQNEGLFILPEGKGKQEGIKAVARTIENVKTGRGSWQQRQEQGRYNYFNSHIAEAAEFEPKETEPVDIMLVEFPEKDMTSEDVVAWLEEQKKKYPAEYGEYELALPEHLDDLNADPRLKELTKEEDIFAVALGASAPWKGRRRVAELSAWEDGERRLPLRWWDVPWHRLHSFALVRKHTGT